jgi:hypothetical protein
MGKEHGLLALCSIVIPRTAGPRNSHMVFQTSRAGQPVLNRLLAALHLGGQGERRIFEIFENLLSTFGKCVPPPQTRHATIEQNRQ